MKGFYLVYKLGLESPNNMIPTLAIVWWQKRDVCTRRRDLIAKWKPENCGYTTSCWTVSTTQHASNLKGPLTSNATTNLTTNKPLEETHLSHFQAVEKVTTGVPYRKWKTGGSRCNTIEHLPILFYFLLIYIIKLS